MLCSLSKPSLNRCRDCIVTAKHPPSSRVTLSAFTDSELQLVLTYLLAQELSPTTKRVMQHLPECPEPRMVISICVLLGSIASREALSDHLVECGACLALLSLLESIIIGSGAICVEAVLTFDDWQSQLICQNTLEVLSQGFAGTFLSHLIIIDWRGFPYWFLKHGIIAASAH
ncbi:hypothetical protein C8J57DRAFT_1672431 [Mycena rebaudengoi]|nr:hypothetical protein C8J57DRAFT_1672431 [Mycena rebaudengoi]